MPFLTWASSRQSAGDAGPTGDVAVESAADAAAAVGAPAGMSNAPDDNHAATSERAASEGPFRAEILGSEQQGHVTTYKIQVSGADGAHCVTRRFRHFEALVRATEISPPSSGTMRLDLPPKSFWRKNFRPSFRAIRQQLLSELLATAMSADPFMTWQPLRLFLGIDGSLEELLDMVAQGGNDDGTASTITSASIDSAQHPFMVASRLAASRFQVADREDGWLEVVKDDEGTGESLAACDGSSGPLSAFSAASVLRKLFIGALLVLLLAILSASLVLNADTTQRTANLPKHAAEAAHIPPRSYPAEVADVEPDTQAVSFDPSASCSRPSHSNTTGGLHSWVDSSATTPEPKVTHQLQEAAQAKDERVNASSEHSELGPDAGVSLLEDGGRPTLRAAVDIHDTVLIGAEDLPILSALAWSLLGDAVLAAQDMGKPTQVAWLISFLVLVWSWSSSSRKQQPCMAGSATSPTHDDAVSVGFGGGGGGPSLDVPHLHAAVRALEADQNHAGVSAEASQEPEPEESEPSPTKAAVQEPCPAASNEAVELLAEQPADIDSQLGGEPLQVDAEREEPCLTASNEAVEPLVGGRAEIDSQLLSKPPQADTFAGGCFTFGGWGLRKERPSSASATHSTAPANVADAGNACGSKH